MANGVLLYLGYVLATTLHHQAIIRRASVISIGPYITRLAKGLNLLEAIDQATITRRFMPITAFTL